MISKYFLFTWSATTIVLFLLNGLFHGLIAPKYFDPLLAPLEPVMKTAEQLNFAPVIIQELLVDLAFVTVITLRNNKALPLKESVLTGILFYASTALTWNLSNSTVFITWPVFVTVVDVAWHAATGVVAGWLVFKIYKRKFKGDNTL